MVAVSARLYRTTAWEGGQVKNEKLVSSWRLQPSSSAQVWPEYVPNGIRRDYEEACSIVELSPKSAATLARRALQGMIRDFWEVTGKRSLKSEIDAIEQRVDPATWAAIEVVRNVGNVGAHMERDVNLLIEVGVDDARLLIGLLETLVADWYFTRHDREERLARVAALGQRVVLDRKPGAAEHREDVETTTLDA